MNSEGIELLKSLGFSESQCKIYFALLESSQGESIDRVMSELGVTLAEAEEAVKLLLDSEAVRVVSNRLEANPPKQFLLKLMEGRRAESEKQLRDLSETTISLQKILEPTYWEKRRGLRPEDILEPLDDLASMEIRTVRVIANAEKSIRIFAQTFGWYNKIREELYRAIERKVKMLVIMTDADKSTDRVCKELRDMGAEVRFSGQDWYPIRGTLVDDLELVFLIWATDKKQMPRPVYYRPHYTKNPGLIRVFADAFARRWGQSKPI